MKARLTILLAISLSACGGGGGDDPPVSPPEVVQVPPALPVAPPVVVLVPPPDPAPPVIPPPVPPLPAPPVVVPPVPPPTPLPPPVPQPPPAPQPSLDPIGIWSGTYDPSNGFIHDALCRISPRVVNCLFFASSTFSGAIGANSGDIIGAMRVTVGTLNVSDIPADWDGSGTLYDYGAVPESFVLDEGRVTGVAGSRSIELIILVAGVQKTITATEVIQTRASGIPAGSYSYAQWNNREFRSAPIQQQRNGPMSFTVSNGPLNRFIGDEADGTIFAQGAPCIINGIIYDTGYYGLDITLDVFQCGAPPEVDPGFAIVTSPPQHVANPGGSPTMVAFAVFDGVWMVAGYALL